MEILKINNTSMKVTLSANDMMEYSLDTEDIEYNNVYSFNIIRVILKEAGQKCGFETDSSKLYIQLYASSNGECEIYVKKISEETSKIIETEHRSICVYSFVTMTTMLQACSRLRFAGYSGESSAYKENGKNIYYLLLEERSPLPEEHGGKLCGRNTKLYIYEHCKLICNEAVNVLGKLI